jgi:ABC-type amino acid transport substrate-binding protein
MRKITVIILLVSAALLIGSMTACGKTAGETTTPPASSPATPAIVQLKAQDYYDLFNGKTLGAIYQIQSEEITEQILEGFFKKVYAINVDIEVVYVDSLTDGLLLLRSGKIAALSMMRYTGSYLTQRNSDLVLYANEVTSYSTRMIFSLEKQAQLERVNTAIKSMREDGTLDKLVDQWITNLPVGKEPAGGSMPKFEGAETLLIGISGDAPPLDYIAADGVPGGFNVAVLSEIGRRAKLNIKMVTINSSARFAALQSGKIDSYLWHSSTQSFEVAGAPTAPSLQIDGSTAFLMSDAYLISRGGILGLKK